jgi:hypothetical protein
LKLGMAPETILQKMQSMGGSRVEGVAIVR